MNPPVQPSPSPKLERAIADIRRVAAASRLPHALLVAGHPRGDGLRFVEALLQGLFSLPSPEASHAHVDIHWLEPEGKARQFRTAKGDDVIRPQIEFLSQTSYSGGWKALGFLFADRLGDTAQNVLLKTLEEVGYSGVFAIEREGGNNRVADIALAARRMLAAG